VFNATSTETLTRRWRHVWAAMTADPTRRLSSIDLLDDAEHTRLDQWGNQAVLTQPATAPASIPVLFAAQAARTPEAKALTFQGHSMTYRELDAPTNRLAHTIARHDARPGCCVALLLPRSAEAIVAILAVLKTGAAYLPIDPALPAARIEFLLTDAAPIAAITTADLACRISGFDVDVIDVADPAIDTQPDAPPPPPDPGDIAYFIYTSGTTGVPKGAAIRRRVVAVALLRVRRLGVRNLRRPARWRTTRRHTPIGDRLTTRLPRLTGRRTCHRLKPNPLGLLCTANRRRARTATPAPSAYRDLRRGSACTTTPSNLATQPAVSTA